MTRMNQTVACVAGILAMGVSHAAANVFEYSVNKIRFYEQPTVSAPVVPVEYAFNAFIEMEDGDATSADVSGNPLIEEYPGEWDIEEVFNSQAALDASYPAPGVYTFNIQGGTLGKRSQPVTLTNPEAYPTIPAFTPVSFSGAQGADPTQDLTIEWNAASGATVLFFAVIDLNTDEYIIDELLQASTTSFTIPANSLDPSTSYEIEIVFANAQHTLGSPKPGFTSDSESFSGYASVTIAEFTTDTLGDSGVIDFWFTKARDYEQTSQSPPTTPFEYVVDTTINMSPGDATSATINGNPMTEDFPGEWEIFTGYPDQASLDAAYPGGVLYTFDISGGALGFMSESVPTGPEIYPAPPALTPTSFNAIQNIDTTQDLFVDWITPDPTTDFVIFAIYNPNDDSCVLDMFFPSAQSSFLIPAGTMSPDTEYGIEIGFINGTKFTGSPFPGFGTQAQGLAGYESITIASITTAPPVGCTDLGVSDVIKEIIYTQTADNTQPTQPALYRFDGFMDTFEDAVGSANVSNGITTVPFLEDEPGVWDLDQSNVEFGSKAALDANFPSNMSYTIHIQDGTLGTRDQVVTLSADDYPDVPFFTGTSYSDLNGMDPEQELVINWASPSLNTTHVFLEIYNIGTDDKPFEAELDPATNSITIPADVLESGVMYEIDINHFASPTSFADDCPGFGLGSINLTGFVSSTSVFFTPLAAPSCPADLTGDGVLDFFDISAFLTAFGSSDPVADFTGDGTFDFFDISAFLTAFSSGCQ